MRTSTAVDYLFRYGVGDESPEVLLEVYSKLNPDQP